MCSNFHNDEYLVSSMINSDNYDFKNDNCKNDSHGESGDVSKPQHALHAKSTLTRKLPIRLAAEIAKQRITQAFENISPVLFVVL